MLDFSFDIEIGTTNPPRSVHKSNKHNISKKRSIITIRNKDNLCLARVISVALADFNLRNATDRRKENIKNLETIRGEIIPANHRLQTIEGEKLHYSYGFSLDSARSLTDIPKFEQVIGKQIIVADERRYYTNLLRFGKDHEEKLHSLLRNGHFDVITKLHTFFNRNYFCNSCLVGLNDKNNTSVL